MSYHIKTQPDPTARFTVIFASVVMCSVFPAMVSLPATERERTNTAPAFGWSVVMEFEPPTSALAYEALLLEIDGSSIHARAARLVQGWGRTTCNWFQSPLSCPLGLKFGSSLMMYSFCPLSQA